MNTETLTLWWWTNCFHILHCNCVWSNKVCCWNFDWKYLFFFPLVNKIKAQHLYSLQISSFQNVKSHTTLKLTCAHSYSSMLASRDSLPVSSVSYSPSGTRSRLGVMRWRHQSLPGHRAGRTTQHSGTLYKWVHVCFNIEIKITCKVRIKDQKRTKSKISVTIFIIYNFWFCDFFSDFFWNCLWLFFWNSLNFWLLALVIIVVMSPISNWISNGRTFYTIGRSRDAFVL